MIPALRLRALLWVGLAWAAGAGLSPVLANAAATPEEAAHVVGARPQPTPDFSGHWVLDPKASDDPRERISQGMKQTVAGGPGMRGGMGRGGGMGGGGMGGGRPGGGPAGGMAGRGEGPSSGEMAELAAIAKRLDIRHEDPLLVLVDEHERERRLFTDSRGVSVSDKGGPQRVAVAGWEDGVLVVESRLNEGSKRIQQYRIDAQTGRLVVSTAADMRGVQVVFVTVYDRVKPGAPTAIPAAVSGD